MEISDTLLRQYETIRQTGATNMMMKSNVRDLAEIHDFAELIEVIDNGEYPELLDSYDGERARELVSR